MQMVAAISTRLKIDFSIIAEKGFAVVGMA